ncbi:hypothetical protein [Paraburkholderia xenovorans]|uniref:hypothetical protein n=1 Tax=Paraburkholderia xenovorans TaxID=36873 RepID=UPI0038B9A6E5
MPDSTNTAYAMWDIHLQSLAKTDATPSGERFVPLSVTAKHGSCTMHVAAHYDWMDFHSIPELPQEW